MEVAIGPLNQELEVGQSFESVGDRRLTGGELAGVGNDGVVASQPLLVGRDIGLDARAADLFLALDDELDIHRQRLRCLQPGLDSLQVGEHLALVVGGPARVQIAIAHGRLKRRREPRFQRLGGLNVVMAVNQNRRLARCAFPLGVDERVFLGFDQLGGQPHRRQVVPNHRRGPARVGVVVRLRADARHAYQCLELLLEVEPVRFQKRVHAIHGHGTSPLPLLFPGGDMKVVLENFPAGSESKARPKARPDDTTRSRLSIAS